METTAMVVEEVPGGRWTSPSAEGPLVLIVDDIAEHRDMYGKLLPHYGFRIAEATDGDEGVAMARALLPDVVLMDLAMPRLDGVEATRRLKSAPETAAIPIVVLTGYGLGPMRKDAEDAGCDMFLMKPILPSEVCRAIQQVLRSRQVVPG